MVGIVGLAYMVALVIALWKMFEKAGRPGWEALIPFYSIYIIITKIIKQEGWWMLMLFIPIANIVFLVKIFVRLAKAFGKDGAFGFLFIIFGIGYFILGFGDDKYLLNEPDSELLDRLDTNY